MRRIVLASHYKLAYGMRETLEFLISTPEIYEISAYSDDTDIRDQIAAVWKAFNPKDEVFIFTDIIGGSVTQQFYGMRNDHTHLICGMNLPLILAVALSPSAPMSKEGIHRIIEEAKASIIYANEFQVKEDALDE